jgi:c-di-GMP-binding flagellar brake protein YcgR
MNRPRDRSSALKDSSADSPPAGGSKTTRKMERRAHRRYSIAAEVEFRIKGRRTAVQKGKGQTIDISSNGVLFESRTPLPIGLKVELSISWPSPETLPKRLEFYAEGHTVRSDNNRTAIYFKRYNFREYRERSKPASS